MKISNQIKLFTNIISAIVVLNTILYIYYGVWVINIHGPWWYIMLKFIGMAVFFFAVVATAVNMTYKVDIIDYCENKDKYIKLLNNCPTQKEIAEFVAYTPISYIKELNPADKLVYKINNEQERKDKNKELITGYKKRLFEHIETSLNKFVNTIENSADKHD